MTLTPSCDVPAPFPVNLRTEPDWDTWWRNTSQQAFGSPCVRWEIESIHERPYSQVQRVRLEWPGRTERVIWKQHKTSARNVLLDAKGHGAAVEYQGLQRAAAAMTPLDSLAVPLVYVVDVAHSVVVSQFVAGESLDERLRFARWGKSRQEFLRTRDQVESLGQWLGQFQRETALPAGDKQNLEPWLELTRLRLHEIFSDDPDCFKFIIQRCIVHLRNLVSNMFWKRILIKQFVFLNYFRIF